MILRTQERLNAGDDAPNIRALAIGGNAKSPEKQTAMFANSVGGEV
jgi:hypothetical protein